MVWGGTAGILCSGTGISLKTMEGDIGPCYPGLLSRLPRRPEHLHAANIDAIEFFDDDILA
jgi:hypothetical protein